MRNKDTWIAPQFLRDINSRKRLTCQETIACLDAIEQDLPGSEEAVRRLTEEHLPFVIHMISKMKPTGCEMMDLIQIGTLGLIHGIKKYRRSEGVTLATYCAPWIKNEITRQGTDKESLIHIPRRKKVHYSIEPLTRDLIDPNANTEDEAIANIEAEEAMASPPTLPMSLKDARLKRYESQTKALDAAFSAASKAS